MEPITTINIEHQKNRSLFFIAFPPPYKVNCFQHLGFLIRFLIPIKNSSIFTTIYMKQCFTFIFFFISFSCWAQSTLKLSGTVMDEANATPMELTAVVLKSMDSVYIADVFTDNSGKFIFTKLSSGKLYLEISYVGYDKYLSSIFDLKTSLTLPAIKLKKNNTLNEVDITKIKNAIEFKPGKTVYNVGRDETNAGLDGLEVLKKIPGVYVDNNDNITVRGKSGIRVYIDDRPSSMSVESPAEAIKFFPAGSIESIEVITNPGAKYDAAGSGAIINVKLKKEKKMGANGNYSLSSGTRNEFSGINKYNGGLNANIRRYKTNVFINSGLRLSESLSSNLNDRRNELGQSILSSSNSKGNSGGVFTKAGIDYFINDKNIFGIFYLISYNENKNIDTSVATNTYNSPFLPASKANSYKDGSFISHTLNLNYILKTKRAGEEFSFDFTHSILSRKGVDSISTGYERMNLPDIFQYQFSNTLSHVISNSTQVDYSRTLKGEASIDGGIKNSYTGNDSKFNFLNMESGQWAIDSNLSNRFDYLENVLAGYVQFGNKYKKWVYEVGLRGEQTQVKSNLSEVQQKYFNLFPDIQLIKKFEESREFSFSYGRRINRPPFSQLNNAVSYSDKYLGFRGNPKLQPEISNNFEISLQKQFDGSKKLKVGSMGITLFGSSNKNSIDRTVVIDSNKAGYITFENINNAWGYGASYFAQWSYDRWYNATISINGVYNHVTDVSKGMVYSFYSQHSFKFLKKHSIHVNGFYNSKFINSQGYIKAMYQVNASYKFLFKKDKATLSLNVSDIFKTGRFRYSIVAQGYNLDGMFRSESRTAYLTFQYKFSKGWQGDGKKRTKKNTKDNRLDFENSGGGSLGK